MTLRIRLVGIVALGVLGVPGIVDAQWHYPRGYGGYGWRGWGGQGGVNPWGGYMAGMGSFARGEGVYEVDDAQARAINLDTMLKWNKALRAEQQRAQQDRQRRDAEARAERDARVARLDLEDGTTLNNLLLQILAFDPAAIRSSKAASPLGAAAVREVPFEWNTEAITLCINQLTAQDTLPDPLDSEELPVPAPGALPGGHPGPRRGQER